MSAEWSQGQSMRENSKCEERNGVRTDSAVKTRPLPLLSFKLPQIPPDAASMSGNEIAIGSADTGALHGP